MPQHPRNKQSYTSISLGAVICNYVMYIEYLSLSLCRHSYFALLKMKLAAASGKILSYSLLAQCSVSKPSSLGDHSGMPQ